jgi:hypothetical protein
MRSIKCSFKSWASQATGISCCWFMLLLLLILHLLAAFFYSCAAAAAAAAVAFYYSHCPLAVCAYVCVCVFVFGCVCVNRQDYYEPSNSMIHHVIQKRKGNPITLSVVYLAVARRVYPRNIN